MGATISGMACARQIIGCRTSELLRTEGQKLRIYQAEDPSTWPERVQQSIARRQGTSSVKA